MSLAITACSSLRSLTASRTCHFCPALWLCNVQLAKQFPTSSERHLEDAYLLRITVRWELLQQVENDIEDVEDQHNSTKALSHLPLHAHNRSNHCGKHKDQQQDGTGNPFRTLSTKVKWLAFGNAI